MSAARPPSVDALARAMAGSGLPHAVCVRVARQMIAAGGATLAAAPAAADAFRRSLLGDVINATGVLLHTNLGRAPAAFPGTDASMRATNLELDLASGARGSRQHAVGTLLAELCGGEAAMVVNNNAAAVLLVVAALAEGRAVLVSRGESVEIGGGFRIPEVLEASRATLVDVGTTNRTRPADYAKALQRRAADVAMILKVHPSNFRVEGFTQAATVAELAELGVPVVADIGSGLIDAGCPWIPGPPPAWLAGEPAARQTLAEGAALVTFSGDKLLGGPQAGVIVGRAELVARCAAHPLARALRPGGHVLRAMQEVTLSYLRRTVTTVIPFWRMACAGADELRARAEEIAAGPVEVLALDSVIGAGSAPGATVPSYGLAVDGDRLAALRAHDPPIVARTNGGRTLLDLRTVDPADDPIVRAALVDSGTVSRHLDFSDGSTTETVAQPSEKRTGPRSR